MGQFPSGTLLATIFAWGTYRKNDLPAMNADPDSITFSGFSGGSWFAT